MNTAKKMLATLEDAKTLQPGTWVTIAWNDAPHEVALFLSYDRNYARSYKNDRGLVLYSTKPTRLTIAQPTYR